MEEVFPSSNDSLGVLIQKALREIGNPPTKRSLLYLICYYFAQIEGVFLAKKYSNCQIIDVHYADLTNNPRQELSRIFKELELECDENYLQACESVIKPTSITRHSIEELWTDELKAIVAEQMRRFDWLNRYTWDN